MKLLIVHNPISGGHNNGNTLKNARRICSRYGIMVKVHETTGENDLEKLRKAMDREQPDKLALFGGDGTFALGAAAAAHTDVPIGSVPCGSANGMAKDLGVSGDCNEALEDILQSRYYADLDLLEIKGVGYCLHFADVGLNANVVRAFEHDRSRGLLTYGKHLVRELAQVERFRAAVETPEGTSEHEVVMAAFSNGRKFGTGVPLNEVSNPFDGKFELNLIKEMSADVVIKTGLSAIDGLLGEGPHKVVISAGEAVVRFDKPLTLQVDGELAGEHDRLELKLIEGAIKYVTTASNPYLG